MTIEAPQLRHSLKRLIDAVRALREKSPALTALGAALVVAAGLGLASVETQPWALGAAAVILVIGLMTVDLTFIPVLAMPATLAVMRVGGALALSDVVLAAASVAALIKMRGRGGMALQPLIWAGVAYLAAIMPNLVLNRFSSNYIEWVDEVFLVIGSLLVGFVIAREGRARIAFGLYGVVCAAVGIMAAFIWATSHQAAYVGDLHKNTVGGMLASALIIAYARPRWLEWRRWFANVIFLCSGIGILASESRQGMIAAVIGLFIVSMRSPAIGRWGRRLMYVAAVPVVVIVWQQVSSQLNSGNQFNSAYQRLTWYAEAIQVWHHSPIFGVGLRWWYTNTYGVNFQPPNAEMEVLTCVGVVGLLGFFAMFAASSWTLLRIDPTYGTVGVAVVVARLAQAQFDLYWVSGQASLLWIVAGACIGAMVRDSVLRQQASVLTPVLAPVRTPALKPLPRHAIVRATR